jgi:putative hemolysin
MNAYASSAALFFGVLLLAAFFAASEVALFSLQKVDREALKEDPRVGETVRHLLSRPSRLLAALLIGGEVAAIAMSAVSGEVMLRLFPELPWLNVVLITPVAVLFGDILPKTFGLRFSRSVARVIARPIGFWNELVSPLRWVVTTIADTILRLLGVVPKVQGDLLREEQLRTLVDEGRERGVIQPIEQQIIHNVFEFGDLPVSRLMTPRPDIFSVALITPFPELLTQLREAQYSRVPVWQGSPENIVGVLLVKDLLRLRGGPQPNARQLQKTLHPAVFVPPSKRAQDLLREFRAKNSHLAMVVDEHGSCVGLVTLDDLLTELVGEVLDESDAEERTVIELQPNVWSVKASMDIDDFADQFELELPEGDWTTLAGFVFHLLGTAPNKGDEARWRNLHFLVAGVEGRRITEVTVTFATVPTEEAETEEGA